MALRIYIGEVDARGFFKTRNKTTKKLEKTHFDVLLGQPDHPMLRKIAKIEPDYDLDPLYSLLSVAARNVLGPIPVEEIDQAFDYVCSELRNPSQYNGHKRFFKTTFMTLQPSKAQKVYLHMLGQG